MSDLKSKTPAESAVSTRYLVMPEQANPHGTAFGGAIIAWIDMVAAMTAERHASKEVVTASIDSIAFMAPIHIGDHVVLKASVNYVGRTSMEIGVQVSKQNPVTNENIVATTAHLTFVALDENKKPISVPPIIPETDDEKRRYENAKIRVKSRKEMLQRIK